MASWMIHLRVADLLLDRFENIEFSEFVMGNIAPDSGVPNEDWTKFTPSRSVSHFQTVTGNTKGISVEKYVSKYFTKPQQREYTRSQYSFYLGYLVHLLTDICWKNKIYLPAAEKYAQALSVEGNAFMDIIKEDWYDLDFLYLRDNPQFRAFRIYEKCIGFENSYMDEFSKDAFDNRRAYITQFYREPNDHLDREYPYLTRDEANRFVQEASAWIMLQLNEYCCN